MIKEGDKIKQVIMPDENGKELDLSNFKNTKNIILYFYPKDDTPGCTIEAKDFRDLKSEFEKYDTVIMGVSKDDAQKHCKFIEKYDLNFQLLSDLKGDVLEYFGVYKEKSMFGKKYMGIERSTFLIDKLGVIRKIWRKVSVTNHAKEVLEKVKGL